VRDSSGNPEAALSKRFASPSAPATIEALAALEAVKLAKNLGLTEVEFEGDASEIISTLEDPSANLTRYGNIISDTQVEAGSLQWFCFLHVKRRANEVAHVLARKAKDIVDSFLWTQFMPPDVIHVILKNRLIQ
jgi:ribonuclease HI